jgi:glycosyltransferase involved in cell wall biosynthesis
MDKKPLKISIITPSYNQVNYIEQTIRSVVHQKYPEVEYIVMDGGSTDGTKDIILHHEKDIDFWVSEPDKGQADAIYRGFERAAGDIIGWLNSDDLLMPGALNKVGTFFMANRNVDCVSGGCLDIDEEGRVIQEKGKPKYNLGIKQNFKKLLFWEMGFYQPASFWRRDAFFRVGGFDVNLRFCFDYDMYLRLASEKPFGCIDDFLACFRNHGESKTSTISDTWAREKDEVLRRHGLYDTPAFIRYMRRRKYVWAESLRKRNVELDRRRGEFQVPMPP